MAATLDEEQEPIFGEMASALIEATPEWWSSATLELTAEDGEFGSGLGHSISNEEHPDDVVEPTDELFAATRALELACARHGDTWRRCVFRIEETPEGEWRYVAEFER